MRWSLFAIDVFVVFAFTTGGMVFHDTPGSPVAEFFRISAPFLIGVLGAAWSVGAWEVGKGTCLRKSGTALGLGLLLSFGLRAVQRQALPTPQFLIPSILFFVLTTAGLKGLWWRKYGGQLTGS